MNLTKQVKERILATKLVKQIFQYEKIDSTMRIARRMVEDDSEMASGTMIITESQEAGYGRFGREWFSPDGGLYFTIILGEIYKPSINLVTGLSVAELIERRFRRQTKLSWPNDILVEGKKISGILAETTNDATLIGIGFNSFISNLIPDELCNRATSIPMDTSRKIVFLSDLIIELENNYSIFKKFEFEPFLPRFNKRMAYIGEEIQIISGKKSFRGTVLGVDEQGAIIIDDGREIRNLNSAEISAHDFKTQKNS